MSNLNTNKFKVGDEVKISSLGNTIRRFGGVDFLLPIGSTSVVNDVCKDNDEITLEDNLLYDPDDLKLIKSVDEINASQDESTDLFFESDVLLPKNDEDDFTCCLGKGIESDGGSSDYYFTSLPKHMIDQIVETGGIEIKDIIRYVFDNNADAFNIVKAQKRIVESLKGKGKAGITSLYDANKIRFFAEEQYNALNQKES